MNLDKLVVSMLFPDVSGKITPAAGLGSAVSWYTPGPRAGTTDTKRSLLAINTAG